MCAGHLLKCRVVYHRSRPTTRGLNSPPLYPGLLAPNTRKRLIEDLDRSIGLFLRQHQRRAQADRVLPCPEHQQSPSETVLDDGITLAGGALLGLAIAY